MDFEVAVQLHAGYALEAGVHQVHGKYPLAELEAAGLHHRAGADAEILPAVGAAIRHRLAAGNGVGAGAPTVAAIAAGGPAHVLKPLAGAGLVGE